MAKSKLINEDEDLLETESISPDPIEPDIKDEFVHDQKPNQTRDTLNKIISKFENIESYIMDSVREDREKIDHYITMFTGRAANDDAKAIYIESITSLLNAKLNTTVNAARLLDSMAKMVSAIKNVQLEDDDNVDLSDLT